MAAFPPAEITYEEARSHQNKQAACYGIIITFYTIAVLTVFIRLASRTVQRQSYGLDDWFIIGALIVSVPFTAATIIAIKDGVGRHVITLTDDELIQMAKMDTALVYLFPAFMVLVKFSILAFSYRLFGQVSRFYRWATYFLAAWAFLWMVGLYVAAALVCQPFSRYWSLTDPCTSGTTLGYSGAALDAANDLLIYGLIQSMVWRLQMPKRRKISVSIILSIGFVATVMGILKGVYDGGTPGSAHPLDYTYNTLVTLIANSLEPYLAMTCACLPALPGLFTWIRTEGFSRISSRLSRIRSRNTLARSSRGSPNVTTGDSGRDELEHATSLENSYRSDIHHHKVHVRTDVTIEQSEWTNSDYELPRWEQKMSDGPDVR